MPGKPNERRGLPSRPRGLQHLKSNPDNRPPLSGRAVQASRQFDHDGLMLGARLLAAVTVYYAAPTDNPLLSEMGFIAAWSSTMALHAWTKAENRRAHAGTSA